ncbi:MAG: endonuclease [Sulfurovaceae bacterium]|nr:endonuclease [Sulfurovaceae bacterium]
MKKNILIILLLSSMLFAQNSNIDFNDDEDDVATIEPEVFSAKSEKYSFSRSKRILATKIYRLHKKTFYAGCDYEIQGKKLVPIADTCGFHYRKNPKRANRIEWEHIVPAWHFGHVFKCWKQGGRKECRDTNAKFRQMEADMHNLVPSIGEINGDRSNYPYGNIPGEKRVYGKVDMEIESSKRVAEPKKSILGDIARTYFYMHDKYNMYISPEQEKMLIKWNNQDPVSRWEKKKNLLVKDIQGDDNEYISHYRKITALKPITADIIETNNNFTDVKNELKNRYSFIFDHLSKPIATILLLIMTIFTLYMRKRKK